MINGETTHFVGNYYEKVVDGAVTKNYFAGAAMIAVRKDGELNFSLSDHLGSTSITTDASGTLVSELRYKPWGEVRYESGGLLTNRTFTNQYSHVNDFGLMFYGARFYDPQLSRFTSSDTIVPAGVQGYDRYNYVNNRPTVNIDPSGHYCVGDDPDCVDDAPTALTRNTDNTSAPEKCTSTNTSALSTTIISAPDKSGTIYATIPMSSAAEVYNQTSLSVKAEQSYDGWSGSGAYQFSGMRGIGMGTLNTGQWLIDVTGSNININSYPVFVQVNWQQSGSSPTIMSVGVTNQFGTAAKIAQVIFSPVAHSPFEPRYGDTVIRDGQNNKAYYGDHFDMAVGYNNGWHGKMIVQLNVTGGFPRSPYVTLDLNNIPAGCSVQP